MIYVGAKFIIRHDGVRVDLRYVRNKNDLSLEHGWIVERHLRDDDYIIFNRQPSLHKMSIMGHKVKVTDNTVTVTSVTAGRLLFMCSIVPVVLV
jgi:DNA-directed RNA polymerase beta' subunit